ncbi:MAG: hypothetical protein AAF911_14530 [Planctomycetota bacterium]
MRRWWRAQPLPVSARRVSDVVRGGLAGGIIASLPAGVLAPLVALAFGPSLDINVPLLVGPIVVAAGAGLGGKLGWIYGIKARGDWLLSRYPRGFCRYCRYDLRGSRGDRCPECGGRLRPAQLRYRQRQGVADE